MVPTIVLIGLFVIFRVLGHLGVEAFKEWNLPLRLALALMFLLTASAHWGRGRQDLIRMVPPMFSKPELLVTVTGILEILGAIGLLIPATAKAAAICLALLMAAMFPANIRAAREQLTIMGRPAPGLILRTAMQILFIGATLAAGLLMPARA